MSYSLRRASRADLTAIMEINKVSMPEQYSPAFWTHHLNQFGDMFYVAEIDDKIVGYIMCHETVVQSIRTGIVVSMAVDLEYRGKGIGEALMKQAHFAMRSRNIPMAGLQVRKSNKVALALYNKMGYTAQMTIPQYYSNPQEDGWLLTYVL